MRKTTFFVPLLFFVLQFELERLQKALIIKRSPNQFVSWKEIEIFAKQFSIYNNPNIILFALSTTEVSNEAR